MPLVSAIITTYNSAAYLGKAIESVITQTCPDMEILVIDDGSTDNTREVVSPYLGRVRYIWQENQERSAARNHGATLAQGTYLAFLDGDDVWVPEKTALQVEAFKRFPQAVMVHGCAQMTDEQDVPTVWYGEEIIGSLEGETESYQQSSDILFGSSLIPSIAMVRHDAFQQVKGFDASIQKGIGEDWDFWIRLSRVGPFVRIPRIVTHYRTFRSEREIHKRASDYYLERSLYIIRKNAAADPERFPEGLTRQAEARMFLQSGMAHLELDHGAEGRTLITRAVALDAALSSPDSTVGLLESNALRVWRDRQCEQDVRKYLQAIIGQLPLEMQQSAPGISVIMARAFMSEVFSAVQKRNWDRVNTVIWRALRLDPSWLRNHGVWSIVFKTCVHQFQPRGSNK